MAADFVQLALPGGGSASDALSGRSSVRSSPAPTSSGAPSPASSPAPAASSPEAAGSRTTATSRGKQPAAGQSSSGSSSGAAGSDPSRSNPPGKGRSAASGSASGNSGSGGQTARTPQGRGASNTSGAGATPATAQGTAAQAAAAATDFSAALAQSLAATPPEDAAPTNTSAGKATADSAADGSDEPPAKHAATDPVSSALTLLEQALAGALGGVVSAPATACVSGSSTNTSATGYGTVSADGKSNAAALSALLTQGLATDSKPGASGPDAGASNPTPTAGAAAPAAPAVAANTAAAALTAAAQLSPGSHVGAQGTIDSSRMALSSPVGSGAWTEELGTQLTWMAHQGIESASLQLSPEHLGPLQVTISVHDGQASVWFGAAQADTRTALQQSLPQLRQLFAGQGLTLADAGVSRESPRDQSRQSPTRPAASVSGVGAVTLEGAGTRASTTGGLGLLDTYV